MSGRIRLSRTPIDGLAVMERIPAGDARGELERLYCSAELGAALHGARSGVASVRVHDVRETVQALSVQAAIH